MNNRSTGKTIPMGIITAGTIALAGVGIAGTVTAQDDSSTNGQSARAAAGESGLRLPEGLDDPAKPKYTIEERRIGTRLERVTVHRNNGIDETYEIRKVDSMSANEANELGEVPNVRRWTLGSW